MAVRIFPKIARPSRLTRVRQNNLTGAHTDNPRSVLPGQFNRMQIHDGRNFGFRVNPFQIIHDLLCGQRIQGSHRLVRQNDLGLLRQHAGDCDPLLLSAGQLVRAGIRL